MNIEILLGLLAAGGNDNAAGGLIVIAVCIGLCILMNQPQEKVTDYELKGTKTERYR